MQDIGVYINRIVEILKKHNPYLILLFGSYAYGEPQRDSDVDILFVSNDDFTPKNKRELFNYRMSVIRELRNLAMEIPLDIIIYMKPMFKHFKSLNSFFAREILSKGIVLYARDSKILA